MSTVKTDLPELAKFQKEISQCIKCGFCAFFCPIYQEERLETSVARGKNVLIRALMKGELELSPQLARHLNKCLLCQACSANCPAKAQILPGIIAARAEKVKRRGLPLGKRIVFRSLMSNRSRFGKAVRIASKLQWLIPKTGTRGTIRHLPLFLSALGRGRQIPPIADRFLRDEVPLVSSPPQGVKTTLRVGFFAGCATDFIFPQVGKKMIAFLNKNGVEVVFPKEQSCCGAAIFLGSGDFETARQLADTNVKAFASLDMVITGCATCGSALKDYPRYLADTPARKEAYTQLASKVKDISQFLVDVLKLPASAYQASAQAKGLRVTWHDPCHLNRHQGVKEQPRQILKSIHGIEFVEMPNADRCCGMGGTFTIDYYDLSKQIADRKMADIKQTKADAVVTSCPGCMFQLIDGTGRQGMSQKVMHLIELLE